MGGLAPSTLLLCLVLICVGGAGAAWWVDRRTELSPRNWYLATALAAAALVLILASPLPLVFAAPIAAALLAMFVASVLGHRWHLAALGAGGGRREHELARVMIWDRAELVGRPRKRIVSQGELVIERSWPRDMPYVPMGGVDAAGRVPRAQGRHILVLGGTGSGKTVSASRITLARVLADRVPALVLDPKGDEDLRAELEAAARYAGRPFVVFDPFDEQSDRWDPLWSSEPGRTVARILSPIQTTEPYYADTLRIHLGVVAEALAVLGLWPVSMPLLLEAAQAERFEEIRDLINEQGAPRDIARRIEDQAGLIRSRQGERDIASGAQRLKVIAGTSFRDVLTPREDGRAVQLPRALRAGAIVLWRTRVEDIPEEAEGITTLALADAIATAAELRGELQWLVVIDEFGSVLSGNAARRALGILGRARSAGGQAIVVTQSAADVPTATENDSMLESLSDNFSGFIVHRQTSAESREWVAKLCGTRELWRSTDRTGGGGSFAEGSGSRRRVHEFIVRPDALKDLSVGQAYVWTPSGPAPSLVEVAMAPRLAERPAVDNEVAYGHAGARALEEYRPSTVKASAGGAVKKAAEAEDHNPQGADQPSAALAREQKPARARGTRQDPRP